MQCAPHLLYSSRTADSEDSYLPLDCMGSTSSQNMPEPYLALNECIPTFTVSQDTGKEAQVEVMI